MPDLAIRPYVDADEGAVLNLLAASLGKTVDERYRGFFCWKHLENPFGRSFMWVGEINDRIVGFRSFLRWRFVDPAGDPVDAVRAVDTATDPGYRGMGIFQELTMHGLAEMRPAGINFVFNTPNSQSLPGYLKMGWVAERRIGVQVRPSSLLSAWRISHARTAAVQWSLPRDVGGVAVDELDSSLLAPERRDGDLVTARSPEFFRWRYAGCRSVASTAVPISGGAIVMRFRQRGDAIECTIGDVLGSPNRRTAGRAVRCSMGRAGADYAIASTANPLGGMLRARRLGPIQTRRQVADRPLTLPLSLTLGDVELF